MRPIRVLAVDDEPAVRELIVRALEECGYEVVAVPDAQTGVAAAHGDDFDLVVANSFMPGLHGEQFMAHLRRMFPDVAILYLDDIQPFTLHAFVAAVAHALPSSLLQHSGVR